MITRIILERNARARRDTDELVGIIKHPIIIQPPRVQIAAGIALVAGFMLLSRRRMMDDVRQEQQEAPVALQQ